VFIACSPFTGRACEHESGKKEKRKEKVGAKKYKIDIIGSKCYTIGH
jgi:hypothetical protein